MTRESVDTKARRYLGEARLTILRAGKYKVLAEARGESKYKVAFRRGRWSCSCPAYTSRCAHVVAVRLVASPKRRRWWPW